MGSLGGIARNMARTRRVSSPGQIKNTLINDSKRRRFPVISGLRVSWDSCRPPGQRVLGIWLLTEVSENMDDLGSGDGCILIRLVDGPAIEREKGGRKYKIVTREYMAQGHDGFLPLKGCRYLIDDENGQMMSTLVRKYLLGSWTTEWGSKNILTVLQGLVLSIKWFVSRIIRRLRASNPAPEW